MKQHITKVQWEELTKRQQRAFEKGITDDDLCWDINIGQMIEFLGDDLVQINLDAMGVWTWAGRTHGDIGRIISDSELADALWEAVKHKLK